MDILASSQKEKKFSKFWKQTKTFNLKSNLPVSVEGVSDPVEIANVFRCHFDVVSPLMPTVQVIDDGGSVVGDLPMRITSKEVLSVIRQMSRGKSPGHDGLSIEHLKHAGVHLSRVLAMFFTLCVRHSYLPKAMIETVVVPIVKNKTGDISEVNNYRPISLATILARVLDGVLDQRLSEHIKLHDAQFGFREGLSTESAIYTLKHTVRYYTSRKTNVYAAFLDLSKAFDLVSYDILWEKLRQMELPDDLVRIFKYWYSNQTNHIRWAGSRSDSYRTECGVRQGGITSPKLFNLYVNQLIVELSNANVGCSIDRNFINNISYADDMVLLSPSISGLRSLLNICESYAVKHGLRYNVKKSELLVFREGSKDLGTIPPVTLGGIALNRVYHFKYLGHVVTDDLCDDLDMERERRALSVRCNMVARRFARCTESVKVTLFKSFCQTFYACSLWVKYTKKCWNTLRVQYNNAFRVLLGLPKFCSASSMFAEYSTDGFEAILRKRTASMMKRVRDSSNGILKTLLDKPDCPIVRHWVGIHTKRT